MTNLKFTKGEWYNGAGGYRFIVTNKGAIAEVFRKSLKVDRSERDEIPVEECLANAKLIAASPRMLKALIAYLEYANDGEADALALELCISQAVEAAIGQPYEVEKRGFVVLACERCFHAQRRETISKCKKCGSTATKLYLCYESFPCGKEGKDLKDLSTLKVIPTRVYDYIHKG